MDLIDSLPNLTKKKDLIDALPDLTKKPDSSSARDFFAATMPMMGGALAPDIAMGARQVIDAASQLGYRGLEKLTSAIPGVGGLTSALRQGAESANAGAKTDYENTFPPQTGSDVARGLGQALITAPLLPMRAAGLAGTVAQGAGAGAASNALTPVYNPENFWRQKAAQAGEGALTGGAAAGALNVAARAVAPSVSPDVQKLLDAGVTPTPGAVIGGVAKATEDKLTSVPLIGDMIKLGQRRSIADFNRAVYERTLAPLGPEGAAVAKSAPIGNEGIAQVGDFLSSKYEQALPKVTVRADPELIAANNQLAQMASDLPPQQQSVFRTQLNRVWNTFEDSGLMSGASMKELDTKLGSMVRGYKGSPDFDQRQLGSALAQLQSNLRQTVARSAPDQAPLIKAIDQGWANLTQLENAGSMLGAKEGVISPAQYLNAIKRSDTSVRDRQFARGLARNQDLGQAADAVLPNKYPDSGSIGRGLVAGVAGGGLGALNPLIPGALAVGSLAYTPWGQRAVAALLAKRPASMGLLGDAMKQAAPYLGAVGPAGLLGTF